MKTLSACAFGKVFVLLTLCLLIADTVQDIATLTSMQMALKKRGIRNLVLNPDSTKATSTEEPFYVVASQEYSGASVEVNEKEEPSSTTSDTAAAAPENQSEESGKEGDETLNEESTNAEEQSTR